MRFRLAPNILTLDDLERPKRPLAEVNKISGAPTIKISTKIDRYHYWEIVG